MDMYTTVQPRQSYASLRTFAYLTMFGACFKTNRTGYSMLLLQNFSPLSSDTSKAAFWLVLLQRLTF